MSCILSSQIFQSFKSSWSLILLNNFYVSDFYGLCYRIIAASWLPQRAISGHQKLHEVRSNYPKYTIKILIDVLSVLVGRSRKFVLTRDCSSTIWLVNAIIWLVKRCHVSKQFYDSSPPARTSFLLWERPWKPLGIRLFIIYFRQSPGKVASIDQSVHITFYFDNIWPTPSTKPAVPYAVLPHA